MLISLLLRSPIHNGLSVKDYADAVLKGDQSILTRSEYISRYSADQSDIDFVTSWANNNQISVHKIYANSRTIKLNVNDDQLSLFGSSFSDIPQELNGIVEHVVPQTAGEGYSGSGKSFKILPLQYHNERRGIHRPQLQCLPSA